jgi:hypothetical protein
VVPTILDLVQLGGPLVTETQTVDLAAWLTAVWDEDVARLTHPTFCGPVWPTTAELLARIAADRKILELHRGPHECRVFKTGTYPANWTGEEIAESGEWVYVSTEYFEDEPCPTKLVLASPYKGREGWLEEWADE